MPLENEFKEEFYSHGSLALFTERAVKRKLRENEEERAESV